jgi:hypothetical protein
MLGKILSTTFFPEKSFNDTSFMSFAVKTNSGAGAPEEGSSPIVLAGLGPNLVCAILNL